MRHGTPIESSRADASPVGVERDYPQRRTARTHLFDNEFLYSSATLLQCNPTQCEAASLPLQQHLDPLDSILLDWARFG